MTVALDRDAVIDQNTQLRGGTVVGTGALVGPDVTLVDTVVGAGASVVRSHAVGAEVGPDASVGPYAYLRPAARLAEKAKVGTFVEVKNSQIGAGSKVPHLTYVGDATIGEQSNIGAASVFVNYDGVKKHRTVIGSHARTGADNMFVAPVEVGDGAYTAAGSVIIQNVPPGALAVARGPQPNIEGWVLKRRAGTAAAAAAAPAARGTEMRRSRGRRQVMVRRCTGIRRRWGGHPRRGILQPTSPRPTTCRDHRPTGADGPMGSIVAENRKSLMLFSGRGFPELAKEIGEVLGVAPTPTDAYDFANGEIFVRFKDSVRGSDAFVVQSITHGVNTWVMETLIMIDALKRGSAKRITVVLPFYPYSRQDKKHRGREPISARLMADLMKTAGANRLVSVDLHAAQIQGFFDGPGTTCSRWTSCRVRAAQVRGSADDRGRAGLGRVRVPSAGRTGWAVSAASSTRRGIR